MCDYKGRERREFLRHDYEKPLKFRILGASKGSEITISRLLSAVSKNLSAAGILFTTRRAPELSSLLAMEFDYRTINICREIDDRALVLDNKLLGKVVRIEDNEDGLCDVGVAFIKKTDEISNEMKKILG